jgi:hypothetical protein
VNKMKRELTKVEKQRIERKLRDIELRTARED